MNLKKQVQKLSNSFLDLLYPRNCVGCGCPVEYPHFQYICENCLRDLYLIDSPYCSTCGAPFFGKVESSRSCPHCYLLDPIFKRGRSIFLLRGVGKEIIHCFKYHQGFHLLKDIKCILKEGKGIKDFVEGATLVPVPLHSKKLRERGFNQSLLFARMLANLYKLPMREILQRVVDTPTQTLLNRKKREHNLKNAFALSSKINLDPKEKYLIVDDVFTTGSTLNACCKVLKNAGAKNLYILTLGHG
jgi:competence protein ComFC